MNCVRVVVRAENFKFFDKIFIHILKASVKLQKLRLP
jgi:hypothetical protein